MINLTGWQKEDILDEISIRLRSALKLADKYKDEPTYYSNTEFMQNYLDKIENCKRLVNSFKSKLDNGEYIDDKLWVDLWLLINKSNIDIEI